MMTRTTRPMNPVERQHLQRSLDRLRSTAVEERAPLAGHWLGLAIGVGFSLVAFAIWEEVVWQAGLAFSFLGLVAGAMYGGEGQSGKKSHKSSLTRVVEETLITGEVEELELQISGAVVLREQGEDVWFLQVEPDQLLCIWDPEAAKERLRLVWAKQGEETRIVSESWSGAPLQPLRSRRAFRVGEFRPRYGASLIPGSLDDLDATLLRLAPERKATGRPIPQLAHDVEALGFYKFVTADLIDRVKAEYEVGPEEWFSAAGRGFEADGELLCEGGVATLLEVMQPALAREGVTLGAVSETVREGVGLLLTVGEASHTLWSTGEPYKVLVERLQGLLDRWLEKAGSKERCFVRGPQLVLLTAELNEKL